MYRLDLSRLSKEEEKILQTKLSNLELDINDSWLFPLISQIHRELTAIGIHKMRPIYYTGDEWFSPSNTPAVAIPFAILDPKISQIEKKIFGYLEGGQKFQALRLLRHEVGHAFDHAYKISDKKSFAKVFGPPTKRPIPESSAKPYSRKFFHHVNRGYGQTHPCEDFAETFAYYLAKKGRIDLSESTNSRVAIQKIEYVKRAIGNYGCKQPYRMIKRPPKFYNIQFMDISIKSLYRQRLRGIC